MSFLLTNLLAAFLLPPLSFLCLGIAGLVLLRRKPKVGRSLIVAMLALLWIFSLQAVGGRLLMLLERNAHTPVDEMRDAQAIVVLGGGTYIHAPEYDGSSVNVSTLARLRLASTLHRKTNLPILVSGGNPAGRKVPEALAMQEVLELEFGVPVRWTEVASVNTSQNAAYSMKLLTPMNIRTIVLVTQAWHMPRSKRVFEAAGFKVLPAGTAFEGAARWNVPAFLPSLGGLRNSRIFMREAIGLLWYRIIE